MARASELAQTLRSPQWGVLDVIRRRDDADGRVKTLVSTLTAALNDDEHVTALDQQLEAQHHLALLMIEQSPPPSAVVAPAAPVHKPDPRTGERRIERRSVGIRSVKEVLEEVEQALLDHPELRADIECRIYQPESSDESGT